MNPRKDLLNISSLTDEEIHTLLDSAGPMKELFTKSVKKVPALKGKSVLTLFYEPSTRTRSSFEVAAERLSADVTNFTVSTSSVVKGESVQDTIATLQAMKVDYVIVRHYNSGLPNVIARHTCASVINAGDGAHAHPSQALLDSFTIREVFPEVRGKRVLINEAFAWKPDVIYLLRVQKERQDAPFFPSAREYNKIYGVTEERLKRISDEGLYIMHPGPVNRGVEICDLAMDYERCLINRQVENGIACRMSILYHLTPQTQH